MIVGCGDLTILLVGLGFHCFLLKCKEKLRHSLGRPSRSDFVQVEVMEGIKVKDTAKRAIVTVIVFVIIYVLSGPIIGYTNYDMYLKGIEFLSAVIGAGCYWIGSNKK